jgi:hypothetical protein
VVELHPAPLLQLHSIPFEFWVGEVIAGMQPGDILELRLIALNEHGTLLVHPLTVHIVEGPYP